MSCESHFSWYSVGTAGCNLWCIPLSAAEGYPTCSALRQLICCYGCNVNEAFFFFFTKISFWVKPFLNAHLCAVSLRLWVTFTDLLPFIIRKRRRSSYNSFHAAIPFIYLFPQFIWIPNSHLFYQGYYSADSTSTHNVLTSTQYLRATTEKQ